MNKPIRNELKSVIQKNSHSRGALAMLQVYLHKSDWDRSYSDNVVFAFTNWLTTSRPRWSKTQELPPLFLFSTPFPSAPGSPPHHPFGSSAYNAPFWGHRMVSMSIPGSPEHWALSLFPTIWSEVSILLFTSLELVSFQRLILLGQPFQYHLRV